MHIIKVVCSTIPDKSHEDLHIGLPVHHRCHPPHTPQIGLLTPTLLNLIASLAHTTAHANNPMMPILSEVNEY